MPSFYLDLDRDLAAVLKLVLTELKKNRVLENVADPEKLIEDTVENIKEALGDSISRESLNDPAMKLKLMTALVATFTHGKGQDKFNFAAIFEPANELALKKEIGKMLSKYFVMQPEEAKALLELTKTFEAPELTPNGRCTPRPEPGNANTKPEDEEKNVFAAVYADDGSLVDILEDVSVPQKDVARSIITISEMLSSDLIPEYREKLEENHFLMDVQEKISEAHLNSSAMRPTPPGTAY